MHQPLYKDIQTSKYLMPWVRLHCIKDYLDMLLILEKYPNIKQTFNLVPSLLEQIEDYSNNNVIDNYLELSIINPENLSSPQKSKIIEFFFDLNWEKMIYKYPRYYELLDKRENFRKKYNDNYLLISNEFTKQEILDLTVWFNLAWFDYTWQSEDSFLSYLINKNSNFSLEERKKLIEKQFEIIRRIIPEYKKLYKTNKVELTTTPYYHPILPLLCDTNSHLVARPNSNLPKNRFKYPEDCNKQIEKAIVKFNSLFNNYPKGMWPSEQSVSPEAIRYLIKNNINWIVSDEGILFNTIKNFQKRNNGILENPEILYKPYILLERNKERINILFRDIYLSDMIGFSYSRYYYKDAANDLYYKIKNIQKKLDSNYPYIITIALDGENCWEYYSNDGYDFLNEFYKKISNDNSINLTTVSDYLEKYPPNSIINLENLHSGSWIRSDFSTWIGDPIKNKAWDCLYQARNILVNNEKKLDEDNKIKAWEEIYIAEGSDWFWWFGEGNSSTHDDLFDLQFRLHLQNVYKLLGIEVPDVLKNSLYDNDYYHNINQYYVKNGWNNIKKYDFCKFSGTMYHQSEYLNKVIYAKKDNLFLLDIEYSNTYSFNKDDKLEVFISDNFYSLYNDLKIAFYNNNSSIYVFKYSKDDWIKINELNYFLKKNNLSFEIPITKEKIFFDIKFFSNNKVLEELGKPIEYSMI
jgi:alpha-amylase/alpha-mannosidase (GH57 family)